ncbi:MAG TPA: TRAP transporter large permease subunit, partial [Rhodoferax sp.]|nr:TRAP transporter large permease subunit [Rhodoferax sp.]
EIVIMTLTLASITGLVLALVNRITRLGLLSRLAEQVTFVLMPPLILIFLVLGTIFLGVATPTEGGAMGALGALILAIGKQRLSMPLLSQALESTAKLATFVLFILIGSTVFSFTFNAADGHIWVEHLFTDMPGGGWGFLIVVNILVFVLGMFIDFFEIAFIVLPLLAPVAEKILPGLVPGMTPDMAMIWFGVIIAMNLQTSFLTPPFGFALFYLRSVAAKFDYKDRVTGQTIKAVSTNEIYKGSIAFIVLQLIMVAAIMAFPSMVVGNMSKDKGLSDAAVMEQLQMLDAQPMDGMEEEPADAGQETDSPAPALEAPAMPVQEEDPMKAMQEAIARDAKKAKP